MADGDFERFIREKRFLDNLAEKTIYLYECAWRAFIRCGGEATPEGLKQFVMAMREGGAKASSINAYARVLNVYLRWLFRQGKIEAELRIPLLKEEKVVIKVFSDAQVKALINYRPRRRGQKRLHAIVCLLLDTGIRIEEALTMKREDVDLENLIIKVMGKGGRPRLVPLSPEGRKVLYKQIDSHPFAFVFCTRNGDRLRYNNSDREFKKLCGRLGITGVRASFHTLRHTFALNYVKNGGSLFHLQKTLGHATLEMSRRYCELTTEDLRDVHGRLSPLSRLKRGA